MSADPAYEPTLASLAIQLTRIEGLLLDMIADEAIAAERCNEMAEVIADCGRIIAAGISSQSYPNNAPAILGEVIESLRRLTHGHDVHDTPA